MESGSPAEDGTTTLISKESQFQSCVHCRPQLCIWCDEQSVLGDPLGKWMVNGME